MKDSVRYLESWKIEELFEELTSQGYRVRRPAQDNGPAFDLIAEKPGWKIAYEVKARSSLRAAGNQINVLRRRASEEGYDSFRLIVASPPHRTDIKIEGFETALASFLAANLPSEIAELIPHEQRKEQEFIKARYAIEVAVPPIRIIDLKVEQIDFDHLKLRTDGLRVTGDGVVTFTFEYGSQSHPEGGMTSVLRSDQGFPFRFDVSLDRENRVISAHQITVNTDDYYEDNGTSRPASLEVSP